ncbi:MAG: anthranilate phosphoribosyltransferase [Pirellulales bacterium]|nr:anthranilate phosphoribosyltransferase [Pirellulales bacterium]
MNNIQHWTELCQNLIAGQALSIETADQALDAIMRGDIPDEQIGEFLLALRNKGETADEIAGAAMALRRHMRAIRSPHATFLDTCGTGGDGARTFNISTAAALVAAAAGVPVAKHGNRGISSKSGSADVLTALGVNISADLPVIERCLAELGIGFCFAPLYHPAMKRVADVRRALGVPTIFNLLGPLANPASAPCQLLGVGKPAYRPLLAGALAQLGTRRSVVVSGRDGLDEVTLAGATDVSLVQDGQITEFTWSPADFGLQESPLDSLLINDPADSAALIHRVLDNEPGPPREIVILNAAAGLWTAGAATDPRVCAARAERAIASGAAKTLLAKLAEQSQT